MKKLKGFYQNNRIYCILMAISIFCIALIIAAFVIYFISQTKTDVYGNRLDGIKNVEISANKTDEIKAFIKENEIVDDVTINIKGKIIYMTIKLKDGKKADAETIAIKSLEKLTEEEKDFYDINFIFEKENDEMFPIMGYKKSNATIISWTNTNGESWKKLKK